MKTDLSPELINTPLGENLSSLLEQCVHCGFCNATCPTYQLTGDERDGPRGRIYLIQKMAEGHEATKLTRHHLDNCLQCRNCETTCPSGVSYVNILDSGQTLLNQKINRSLVDKSLRWLLGQIIAKPKRFGLLLKIGHAIKPIMPSFLAHQIPVKQTLLPTAPSAIKSHQRVLVLSGCAQSSLTPNTNRALTNVLSSLGIQTVEKKAAECCGAIHTHLDENLKAKLTAKQTIDAWWPEIEKGIEAILITASGCAAHAIEYPEILKDDPIYAEKAFTVKRLLIDPVQYLSNKKNQLILNKTTSKIAYQSPCTSQHKLKLNGQVEALLTDLGFHLVDSQDPHACCGSAGTHAILKPKIATSLGQRKLHNLIEQKPDLIATANVGCQHHLGSMSSIPVVHWLELIEAQLKIKPE